MMGLNEGLFRYEKHHIRNIKETILVIILGTIITILIELIGSVIAPAWAYPFNFFNLKFDFWFSVGAYIFCIPATFETYLFFKNLLKAKTPKAKLSYKYSVFLSSFSLLLMVVPLFWNSGVYRGLPFAPYIVGLSLFVETTNNRIFGRSIIFDSLKSFRIFISFILTTAVMSLLIELTNLSQFVWRYVNLPFLDWTLLRVPLIVLFGWLPLVGIWLNLYYFIEHMAIKKLKNKK